MKYFWRRNYAPAYVGLGGTRTYYKEGVYNAKIIETTLGKRTEVTQN
jgi:hypothetical protein